MAGKLERYKSYGAQLLSKGFTRKQTVKKLSEKFELNPNYMNTMVYTWIGGKKYKIKIMKEENKREIEELSPKKRK